MGGLATMNRPPEPDEVEVSLFGPGFGECVLVHWKEYGKSDKLNAIGNKNEDFRTGYWHAAETLGYDAHKVIADEHALRTEIGEDLGSNFEEWVRGFLGGAMSDGGGWHQKAEKTMIDNEANPPAFKHEFRVWCVRHRNGETRDLWLGPGRRSVPRDDTRSLQRVQQDFVRGQKFRNLNEACLTEAK